MEIIKENCMDIISDKYPEFKPIWKSYKLENAVVDEEIFGKTHDWGDISLWSGMNKFSDYVDKLLTQRNQNVILIKEIFSYAEHLLTKGDEDVQNAVCTCFLENLLNVTPEQINPKNYIGFLGTKSKEYCRAWDEFTGIKTEGLWD
ncbi:MAG: hypothetical protein H0V82_02340 [Candidatus Protochlamydia sp.]|nr:hypothetical protein [Candidatus Protochlamydia sp.]